MSSQNKNSTQKPCDPDLAGVEAMDGNIHLVAEFPDQPPGDADRLL